MKDTRNRVWPRTFGTWVAFRTGFLFPLLLILAALSASADIRCATLDRDGISEHVFRDSTFFGSITFTEFAGHDENSPLENGGSPADNGKPKLSLDPLIDLGVPYLPVAPFNARLTGYLAMSDGFTEPYDVERRVTVGCDVSRQCQASAECFKKSCSVLPDDIDGVLIYLPSDEEIDLETICPNTRVYRNPSQAHLDALFQCLADRDCIERRTERTAYLAAQMNRAAKLLENRTALIGAFGRLLDIKASFRQKGISRDMFKGPFIRVLDDYVFLDSVVEVLGETLGRDTTTSNTDSFRFAVRQNCPADFTCERAFEQEWKVAKALGKLAAQSGILHPSDEVKQCIVRECVATLEEHLSGPVLFFHEGNQDTGKVSAWIKSPSAVERQVLEACMADEVCREGGQSPKDDQRILDIPQLADIAPVVSHRWPELFFGEDFPADRRTRCSDLGQSFGTGYSHSLNCSDLSIERTR